ncbi:MAG: hypothetical protein U0469_00370 [Candidatus Paceibacterota bacterium]|jgi:cytoskeletal protein RodZ
MRDIRRPYRNSRSSASTEIRVKKRPTDKAREVENFEKDAYTNEYKDIAYDKNGKPTMKAVTHFDLAGFGKRSKKRGEYDILKREAFFNSKSHDFDEEDIQNFRRSKNKKKKVRKTILYFSISIIALALILWTFVFDSAGVVINPKYKDVDVSDTFIFFKEDLIMDYSSTTISKDVMKSAPKEVNQKSSGEITIYNNYSTNPQILIKNTRFQTSDGKIFRINDSVTVPGKNGNTPGSVTAKVSADTYGSDYNIKPSDFTIPGFKGTPRYAGFYAKSVSPMSGGMSGTVSTVSPEDIMVVNNDLKPSINSTLTTSTKKITHDGYFSLYNNLIINYSDNQNVLMTSDQNSYNLTGIALLLSIKKDVLASVIAKQVLQDNYNASQPVHIDDIDSLTFTIDPNADINSNIIKILINGKVRIIWTYGPDNVKKSIAGQSTSQFDTIINKYSSSIIHSSFKVSPPWIKAFPKDINRIKIEEVLK